MKFKQKQDKYFVEVDKEDIEIIKPLGKLLADLFYQQNLEEGFDILENPWIKGYGEKLVCVYVNLRKSNKDEV